MERKVIIHVENRGASFIYHWFIYMIAGLRYIENGGSSGKDDSGPMIKNIEYFDVKLLKKPYNLYLSSDMTGIFSLTMSDFQKQTLELIKDEYKLIEKSEIKNEDIILNNYGEYILNTEYHIHKDGYIFLRNFRNKIEINNDDINKYSKRFYLCRSRSNLLEGNNGIKRRHILNEMELVEQLSKRGYECVFLEDYDLKEKIKMFRLAKTIISPNSGGLVFSLYSDYTNIIELNVRNPHQISRQYQDQCRCFNLPYFKFYLDKVDSNDNMCIDTKNFINFLKNNNI